MAGLNDGELMQASVQDPDQFAVVFDRHYAAIAGFLRRRLERSLADELAAETFLRAFDARERYDPARPDALPWLFGIATHLLSHHRRAEERQLRAFARAGHGSRGDGGFDDADARLDAAAASPLIGEALAALKRGDREALLLYVWAELSYEQVAAALGIPVGTVRSRIHRARGLVRERLERAQIGGPNVDSPSEEACHEHRA